MDDEREYTLTLDDSDVALLGLLLWAEKGKHFTEVRKIAGAPAHQERLYEKLKQVAHDGGLECLQSAGIAYAMIAAKEIG